SRSSGGSAAPSGTCVPGWRNSNTAGQRSHTTYRTHRSYRTYRKIAMSTVSTHEVAPSDNGQPTVTAPTPVVMIRQVAIAAEDPRERALKRQVPAFLASGLFHAGLVAAFFSYSWWPTRDRTAIAPVEQIAETRVE